MRNVSAAMLAMVMGCVVTAGETVQAAEPQAAQKTAFLLPGFPCVGNSCAPAYTAAYPASPCSIGACPPSSYQQYPANMGYQGYPQYQQPFPQQYQGYNRYPVQSYPAQYPGRYPVQQNYPAQYPVNPGYYGAQYYGSTSVPNAPVRVQPTSGYRGTSDPYFP